MKRHPGFTLIELLVTISIMTAVLAFTFAGINNARVRSRDAKRVTDLRSIQVALEQHALGDASRAYPPDPNASLGNPSEFDTYCSKYWPTGQTTNNATAFKGLYTNPCFTDYLAVVPKDPYNANYQYARPACFTINGSVVTLASPPVLVATNCGGTFNPSYGLHVNLESANNSEGKNDLTPTIPQSYDLAP